MTLRELIWAHPRLFYVPADPWWRGEAFMGHAGDGAPASGLPRFASPDASHRRPCATTLAGCFVVSPSADVWRHWFWTDDFDRHGQRVYVGVGPDERGFEIHRHLHITGRWGVAVW